MTNSRAGSFNAYLEYAQRGSATLESRPSAPASLLGVLPQFPNDEAPMSKLVDLSGMTALAFRDNLKKLVDFGFIEISGEPLSETVKLTDKGRDALVLL